MVTFVEKSGRYVRVINQHGEPIGNLWGSGTVKGMSWWYEPETDPEEPVETFVHWPEDLRQILEELDRRNRRDQS